MNDKVSLKSAVVSSLFWKLFERGGVQVTQFIISLIIARLLSPKDYGTVALLMVFINIATVFVQSGLGSALIQKKDADALDFSSVFFYSVILALLLYLILFFCAPLIAAFYSMPQLTVTLRVMSLTLFPGALNSLQNAVVAKNMVFKKQFFSSIIAVILSGGVGIALAFCNYGIWALVFQQLLYQTVVCAVLWVAVKWRPSAKFSYFRTRNLLKYGSKLLLALLIDTIFHNLENLLIGKKFSSETLAFYSKGKQFPLILIDNVDGSVQSVMLPAYSARQDDVPGVKQMLRRTLSLSTYLVFPSMIGLAAVGNPLIYCVLGEKWMDSVPFLQLFCLIAALFPLQTANLQAINAIGLSDIYLKLMVVKRAIGTGLLVLSVLLFSNVYAIVIACLLIEVFAIVINFVPNKRYLQYSAREQMKDIFPNFMISLAMGICTYLLSYVPVGAFFMLLLQFIMGILIYIVLSFISKNKSFFYILWIINHKRKI